MNDRLFTLATLAKAKNGGSGGGGEEVLISDASGNQNYNSCIYVKNVVWPGRAGSLSGCDYLESVYAPESVDDDAYAVFECPMVKSLKFPKRTIYSKAYFVRQQYVASGTLEEVQIGSIGYPVTAVTNYRWLYGKVADNCKLTVYVDADTIANISADVTTNINGNLLAGSLEIIYRNSTTGEVITE